LSCAARLCSERPRSTRHRRMREPTYASTPCAATLTHGVAGPRLRPIALAPPAVVEFARITKSRQTRSPGNLGRDELSWWSVHVYVVFRFPNNGIDLAGTSTSGTVRSGCHRAASRSRISCASLRIACARSRQSKHLICRSAIEKTTRLSGSSAKR